MNVCIGADPGKQGVVVVIDTDSGCPMKEFRFEKFTDAEWIHQMRSIGFMDDVDLVVLEWLTPRAIAMPLRCGKCKGIYACLCGTPARGIRPAMATAEFKMGEAYATMKTAFLACEYKVELITPPDWMKQMKVQGKKHSPSGIRDKAQMLFPSAKPTQMTGDAYLLAHLARKIHRMEPV